MQIAICVGMFFSSKLALRFIDPAGTRRTEPRGMPRWLASLNLAGELYQAYFDTEENAAEALTLAGFTQPAIAP